MPKFLQSQYKKNSKLNYTIHHSKENYKKDYKSYLFFSRRKKWYTIYTVFVLAGVIFLASYLIEMDFDIRGIALAFAILGSVLLIFELIFTFSALKAIRKSAAEFNSGAQNLILESTFLKLSYDKIRYETVFYSQIKKCLILKDVLFIIYKSDKEWPLRINKSEMCKQGFSEILKFFQSKNITIVQK